MSSDLKQELHKLVNLVGSGNVAYMALRDVDALRARLERAVVTEPAPTDAELRARLWERLPAGWVVCSYMGDRFEASSGTDPERRRVATWLPYSTLRAPGGIEACAAALRLLAGEEAE